MYHRFKSLFETRHGRLLSETKAIFLLAMPLIASQLAQMGMNFTDTVMAGRHHETSLAGVAIGSSLWVPCFLFLVGLIMATTPVVAQAWGAKKTADIRLNVQQAMWLALVSGVVMMFVLQWLSQIFYFMEMEAQTLSQALGYAQAISYGLPALAFFQVLRSLNEGVQLTRAFMYVSFIALLINIPLNYAFIYGKLGLPELGGAGCGWASAIVLWIELLLMLGFTLYNRKLSAIRWHLNWCAPQWAQIKELLKLGSPIGVAFLIESSMFALIALFLAAEGSVVVAGHQVAMSVISIIFMIPLSLAMALTIRCGYYIGRQEAYQARYVCFLGFALTLVTASLFSGLILLVSEQIAALYTPNRVVQILAVKLLFLAAIFQFSDSLQVVAGGMLRGYKDTKFTFFVVLLAYWGLGLPLGYSLGLSEYWGTRFGAQGFWLGLIAGLGLASILLVWRVVFVSGKQLETNQSVTRM